MTTLSKAIGSAAIFFTATMTFTAAQAQKVHTDFDHKAPFNDYRTYSFAKVQTTNPLDAKRVKEEIRMDLNYHHLREVPLAQADLKITAVESQHDTKEYSTFYNGLGPGYGWGGWGGWWGGGWGVGDNTTTVQNIPVGTLLVDLYDRNTHNLVWRGVSQEQVSTNLEKDTGKLQKAVDEMFYHFPPKAK